jgi:hypothetical protein
MPATCRSTFTVSLGLPRRPNLVPFRRSASSARARCGRPYPAHRRPVPRGTVSGGKRWERAASGTAHSEKPRVLPTLTTDEVGVYTGRVAQAEFEPALHCRGTGVQVRNDANGKDLQNQHPAEVPAMVPPRRVLLWLVPIFRPIWPASWPFGPTFPPPSKRARARKCRGGRPTRRPRKQNRRLALPPVQETREGDLPRPKKQGNNAACRGRFVRWPETTVIP